MEKKMTVKRLKAIFANPFYAINIHESLTYKHEFLISEEDWIKSAEKLIDDYGAKDFLRTLLSVLKTGGEKYGYIEK